jgi:endonuclease/exonuclease/phosphatase family metal-dependent hydrolase
MIRLAYLFFFAFSVLCFFSVELPLEHFWYARLLSFFILPLLVTNIFFIGYFFLRNKRFYLVLACLFYVIGFKQVKRTIQFSLPKEEGKIKVINANVRIFNVYLHLRDEDNKSSIEMINWLTNADADILILQEYYNENESDIWNSTEKIKAKFPYHHLEVSLFNKLNAEFGQVIFSKHPIIRASKIAYQNKTFNQAFFADILVGDDTVRVYNLHLQSMAIEERKLFDENRDEAHLKYKINDTWRKLVRGQFLRAEQINTIIDHIKTCPYPIILGVDMNDIPYSYAYNEFSKLLKNDFEQRGNGFGFTFNGLLFFLRIDALFSSHELATQTFHVHREIPYSDHFPISATYNLAQKE